MKLAKILIPTLTVAATAATVLPVVTSCSLITLSHDMKNGPYSPKYTPSTAHMKENEVTNKYLKDVADVPVHLAEDVLAHLSNDPIRSRNSRIEVSVSGVDVGKQTVSFNYKITETDNEMGVISVEEVKLTNFKIQLKTDPSAGDNKLRICSGLDSNNIWNDKNWIIELNQTLKHAEGRAKFNYESQKIATEKEAVEDFIKSFSIVTTYFSKIVIE